MKLQQLVEVSAVFVLAAALSPLAQADEVWNSGYGKVVYQSDRGKTAVWTYPQGTIFIEGIARSKTVSQLKSGDTESDIVLPASGRI